MLISIKILNVLIIYFPYRKHTLNCHRMKPALFSVLCEIKEKTGKIKSNLLRSLSSSVLLQYIFHFVLSNMLKQFNLLLLLWYLIVFSFIYKTNMYIYLSISLEHLDSVIDFSVLSNPVGVLNDSCIRLCGRNICSKSYA